MIPPSYYASEAWQAKRNKYLKKKCAWSGVSDSKENPLTLHHKHPIPTRYELAKAIQRDGFKGDMEKEIEKRLANEEKIYLEAGEKDLITICRKCHYMWSKHQMRPCKKCKKKYVRYKEQKYCADCYIEMHKEKKDGCKKEVKKRVRKAKPSRKGKWNPEIKAIHRKLQEKPAPKGRKYRVAFGVKNPDGKRKHMTIYASQLKYLTRILKLKKKIILDKTAI